MNFGMQLTPIVRALLIANILMFVLTQYIAPQYEQLLAVYYPTSVNFHPFQILTHMFMHASLSHIFFNMFGLVTFGPMIESVWGERKFLIFYLLCGLGALALQFLANYIQIEQGLISQFVAESIPLVGASGCLFGLLVAFAFMYPDMKVGLIFIPIFVAAKYVVPLYAAVELFLGLGNMQQGVAHFAHLGGAITGALLYLFWK